MDAIKDALLDFCNTDLAALGNYNVTSFTSDKAFPEMVEDTYVSSLLTWQMVLW